MSHRLYLCGPMTGLPDFNYPAFHEAAARLRAAGFEVVNPAEDGLPVEATWEAHLKLAIAKLVTCDDVATLPGIDNSKGAQLELHIARALGMPITPADNLLAWLLRHGGDEHDALTFHRTPATTPIHTAPAA